MAHKRMFSKDITTSDAFREMPASSQSLYFHLGMEADDDGFLDNYRGLMRSIGASEDDLKILLSKRFMILFPSKIMVVKHWLINNTIRKDRYTETKHLEEKRALLVKENGSYTELSYSGIPNGNQLATQKRIEEDSIVSEADASRKHVVSENETNQTQSKAKYPHSKIVFGWFPNQEKSWKLNSTELRHAELLFERGEKRVRSALAFCAEYSCEDYFPKITKPSELERKWNDLLAFKKKNNL